MKLLATLWTLVVLFSLTMSSQAQDIYDANRIQEVRIYFSQDNWDNTLDSLKDIGDKDRITGDVKLNGITYKDCGIRFKGNSSYNNALKVFGRKKPWNIKADYKNDNQKFPGDYTSIKLANGFRDPSMIREVLSYEIAGKYMPSPRANFAHVYVNDEYYGLYTNTESINEGFMKEHYDDDDGLLFKCDPEYGDKIPTGCPKNTGKATLAVIGKDSICYAYTYELKSKKSDYKTLINFTDILNNQPSKIKDILNVDQTLWMLAFNNVMVNLDSYSGMLVHNYYIAQDPSGRLNPIIWDLNLSLGGFRYDGNGSPLNNKAMQEMTPFLHYKNKNYPLINKLLAIPRYRKIYVAHIRTIIEENFENGDAYRRANELQRIIDLAVKEDENKFYSYTSFKANLNESSKAGKTSIIGIKELMDARIKYLQSHPLFLKTPPKISAVSHVRSSEQLQVKCKIDAATAAYVAYRYDKFGYFSKAKLRDDGESNDNAADDGYYGATIDYKPGMQYYILSENEHTATLHPKRAEYEFISVP